MRLVSTDNSVVALRTLMIGSIDRIEKYMGHLWGIDKDEEDLTEEEQDTYEAFMELRESILDFGNEQICKVKGTKWTKR